MAIVAAGGVILSGMMFVPLASAYGPDPTPTQTATPSPTPTPTPTPPPPPPPPPELEVNGPLNPPNPPRTVAVAPGFVVVGESIADNTSRNTFKNRATVSLKKAPKAKGSKYVVNRPIRLIVRVIANRTYVIKVKIKKKYYDLGTARSDGAGQMSLPVFATTKTGTFTFAMIDPVTGITVYVKVKVGTRN